MHDIPDVGRDFDAEEFGRTLAGARVNMAVLAARCNRGFAYFPSRAGTVHPSLDFDLFGQMVEICHRHGILVSAYFHAGLDHEHLLHHREWCRVDGDGRVYDPTVGGHYSRRPCLNTGYGDYLLATIGEVLAAYPVDGLFLDGFDQEGTCLGIECLKGMKGVNLDPTNAEDRAEFLRKTTREFADSVRRVAAAAGLPTGTFFNGLPFLFQDSWIAVEALPGLGWGYDYLPSALRHARTAERPFYLLTSRFQNGFGDFGGLPPEHALRFDCLNAVANGGGAGVIDCLHPRGRPEKAVYEVIGRIFSEISELEHWTEGSVPLADTAIVDPVVKEARAAGQHDYPDRVRGASRMLMELRCQFDLVCGGGDLSKYRLLVLPDAVQVDEFLACRLAEHVAGGGGLISSGTSLLDGKLRRFLLPEYPWHVSGREVCHPGYWRARGEFQRDIPDMPLGIFAPGVVLSAEDDADVVADFLEPYRNLGAWDGFLETMYAPPRARNGQAAMVRRGRMAHCAFPIFSGYLSGGSVHDRTLLRNVLAVVLPNPLITVENAPSFVQVTLADAPGRRLVHALAYAAEVRGERMLVEDPLLVTDLRVRVKVAPDFPGSVYLAPSRERIPFRRGEGVVEFVIPKVFGYQLVVLEAEGDAGFWQEGG